MSKPSHVRIGRIERFVGQLVQEVEKIDMALNHMEKGTVDYDCLVEKANTIEDIISMMKTEFRLEEE